MLIRSIVLLVMAASALALAACAETSGAMATAETAQAAAIAATQAAIVTTQAIAAIGAASTQMADAVGKAIPSLPKLGKPLQKGTLVIDTPTALFVEHNGHRVIYVKNEWDTQ